ncbi:MAG: hypothetical protein AB3N23_01075 [Paracoccaceae bacterium]
MSDAPVTVELSFIARPDDVVPLASVPAEFQSVPARFDDYSVQTGVLEIHHGEASVRLADAIMWMVPQVCFDLVVAVQTEGEAEVEMWSSDATLHLVKDGDEIEAKGEYLSPQRFPALALLTALVEAGEAATPVFQSLWADDLDEEMIKHHLNRQSAARAALTAG